MRDRNTRVSLLTALGIAAVSLVLTSPGCSSQKPYVYGPEQATVWVDGYPGAAHPVPPEEPQGEVRVASFGITKITPSEGAAALRALHVRMVVLNNGDDTPWTIDTREQEVAIEGEGRSRAAYVNTDQSGLPMVTVPRRDKRTLDLYFPLPEAIDDADQLPRFDFLWQVETGARVVADRTMFRREAVREREDHYSDVTLIAGWGPWWWYDPFYPQVVFFHRPRVVVPAHARPVQIELDRPARGLYMGHRAPSSVRVPSHRR
jgi:hypothetical protein